MGLKCADVGLSALLEAIRVSLNAAGMTLKLFKNNYTPVDGVTVGDLTECAFPGYGSISFNDLAALTSPSANVYRTEAGSESFAATGSSSEHAYGYFVLENGTGLMLWAERFAAGPFDMTFAGATTVVFPALEMKNQ